MSVRISKMSLNRVSILASVLERQTFFILYVNLVFHQCPEIINSEKGHAICKLSIRLFDA